jgi:N-acetylneuraminate synthase
METMHAAFGLPVGLSDHTPGIAVAIAAVALGAAVIEKHFTLDRNLPGPDHKASLEPAELKSMVIAMRSVEAALGDGKKLPALSEARNRDIARKSLVAAIPIRKGEAFSSLNLDIKRPGKGVSPMEYWTFIGEKSKKDYDEDELI